MTRIVGQKFGPRRPQGLDEIHAEPPFLLRNQEDKGGSTRMIKNKLKLSGKQLTIVAVPKVNKILLNHL